MSDDTFGAQMQRLEELIAQVEQACAPAALEKVRELVRTLLQVHKAGLGELLGALDAERAEQLAQRPSLGSLLLLHDLHPEGLETRLARALREAEAALGARAHAELVRLDAQRAHVRVSAAQPGAAALLRKAVERAACEHTPDAVLEIEGGEPPLDAELVPVARLSARGRSAAP